MTSLRAGTVVSNLTGQMAYRSFQPAPLPPEPNVDVDIHMRQALVEAHANLRLLNGLVERIPNMNLFISMYVRKEALLSSQIEGTQATLDDVLDPTIDANKNQNVADVINYIKATLYAVEELHTLPLCNRLIRQVHEVLMQGVRGQDKEPGEFRRSQNWIGPQGGSLAQARYVPPNVEDMDKAMSDLEKYMNEEDVWDHLIRIALIHYQFETIHPFLDGNGRVGRLLISLYLMDKHVLSAPALYISYYLKLHRVEYYDRLEEVRRSGNYEQWVKFFLQAVADTAQDAIETIDRLATLHDFNMKRIEVNVPKRSLANGLRFLAYLEQNPIIDIQKTADELAISYNAVARLVKAFIDMNVLQQVDKKGKTRIFAYEAYLEILRKDTEIFAIED